MLIDFSKEELETVIECINHADDYSEIPCSRRQTENDMSTELKDPNTDPYFEPKPRKLWECRVKATVEGTIWIETEDEGEAIQYFESDEYDFSDLIDGELVDKEIVHVRQAN